MSLSLNLKGTEALDPSKLPPPASGPIDFNADISPILEKTCLRCHGPERPKSRFRLDNRQAALAGGNNGVDIIPGNSAASPLIFYTARLAPDMAMPPDGKGEPLTTNQVALLRAWIDQGAAWSKNPPSNNFAFSLSPTIGGTFLSGNAAKFRELYWMHDGPNGGLDNFELSGNSSPETQYALSGHILEDDYKLQLSVDKTDLGHVHAGWEEYRKYYSDTGGYFPLISPLTPNPTDLYLDIGKAWIDLGLTLPRGPQMKLGYELDYRQGDESTLNWGSFATSNQRNVAPATQNLNETVHIIKFDLEQEMDGGKAQEQFRGEFYNLKTQYNNTDARGGAMENARESDGYVQGMNVLRLEKKFNDWSYASAGCLFSELNSDASFTDTVNNNPMLLDMAPQITLEKESDVLNLNGLLGPLAGLTLSGGVEAEWTRQHGYGGNKAFLNPAYTNGVPSEPITIGVIPTILSSDYDQNTTTESVALRSSRIPCTSLYAEARLQQQTIGQSDADFQTGSGFLQNTAFTSQLTDLRAGCSATPCRSVSLDAYYRRYENDSHYNNDPGLPPPAGYPGFIRARDLLTDEAEAKLAWHPRSWLKTAVSCQYLTTKYTTDTDAAGAGVSPGGEILAGRDRAQVYALNATIMPQPQLYLSATFSYQPTSTTTAANDLAAVVPYRGAIYSVMANGTYALLDKKTELFANFAYSEADYAQNNFAAGLPVGMEYQQQTLEAGLARHIGKNLMAKLRYGYAFYAEPSSGTLNNFYAHSIFATLTYRMP